MSPSVTEEDETDVNHPQHEDRNQALCTQAVLAGTEAHAKRRGLKGLMGRLYRGVGRVRDQQGLAGSLQKAVATLGLMGGRKGQFSGSGCAVAWERASVRTEGLWERKQPLPHPAQQGGSRAEDTGTSLSYLPS